jgi:threonine/homoserine/homoserine lactone efflux protein
MFALSVVFMALTFVVFVGYGLFAAAVRDRHLAPAPARVRRSFAAAFFALGLKLSLAGR